MKRYFAISLFPLFVFFFLIQTSSMNAQGSAPENILINEVDADTPGSDTAEFIELFDGGAGNVSLDSLVLVFYNGYNDKSYAAYDLDGYTTDNNGYFVLGNAGVPEADKIISNSSLQNGADAVALFIGDASDFTNGTAITTTNLIDALVYDTGDADDAGLLVLISSGGQIDEKGNGDSEAHSNQRVPNGSGGKRNTSSYDQMSPTPGKSNDNNPLSADTSVVLNEDNQYIFKESDFPFDDPNGDIFAGIKISSLPSKGRLEYNNIEAAIETDYTDVNLLIYTPAADESGSAYAEFNYKIKDSSGVYSYNSYKMTINVNPINDAPGIYKIEEEPLVFVEDSMPVCVTNKIRIIDVDNINLSRAEVIISDNYRWSEDLLSYTESGPLTADWSESSGTLTLSGPGSRLTYQRALREVTFQNANTGNPDTLTKRLTFQVWDNSEASNRAIRDIRIIDINDAPVIADMETATIEYCEGDPAALITNLVTVTDVDNDEIKSASVRIMDNYQPGEDILIFADTRNIKGKFNPVDGKLSLAGTDTKAGYQTALRNVSYYNAEKLDPSELTRIISFVVDDGEDESNILTRNIDVIAVNDPPIIDTSGVDTTPLIEGDDSLKILLTINDENEDSLKYSAESSCDSIRAKIVFNSPASLVIVPLYNADISAAILVIVSDGVSADTLTFYVEIIEKNFSPSISGLKNYTINEGGRFDNISLDDFVNDENDNDDELVWTITGDNDLVFDVSESRVLSVSIPDSEWFGEETISLKVKDPEGLTDSASIIFTVLAVNDPPVFVAGGIPDIEFNEDTGITIPLGQYVSDCDNDSSEIEFDAALAYVISAKPPLASKLEDANDDLIITVDNVLKTVTFTTLKDSTGKFSVVITASDSFNEAEDTMEVTVLPVNDAPILLSMPDIVFPEDSSFSMELNSFVYDIDNRPGDISWMGVNSSIGLNVKINKETNVMMVASSKNFSGFDIPVILRASDGEFISNPDTVLITVTGINDPPLVLDLPQLSFNEDDTLNVPFDMWQSYVSDPETPDDELMYYFTQGKVVSIETIGPVTGLNLFADENWFGFDTLTFFVSDEDTTVSQELIINVMSVNDIPMFADLPDTVLCDGDTTRLNLWKYTNDIETADENFIYEFTGYDDGLLYLNYNNDNGNLSISVTPGYNNPISFTITVTDEDGGAAAADLIYKPRITTGLRELAQQIPDNYLIEQNYPNPFNPSTTIRFGLPSESNVNIAIYNMLGELVNVLIDEVKHAGYFEYRWNASRLSSGIYIYSLYAEATDRSARFSQVKKMILLR